MLIQGSTPRFVATGLYEVPALSRAEFARCVPSECGDDATCTDAAAPDTGYSCSCGTGYEGATTTNGAAACTAAANDTPTDQTTTQQSTTAPAPSNTVSSAFNARVAVWLPIAVATVIATTQ